MNFHTNAPTPNIMLNASVYGFENEISQDCTTAISAHTDILTKSFERYLSDLNQCSLIVYIGFCGSGEYYIVHDKEQVRKSMKKQTRKTALSWLVFYMQR